MTISSGFHLEIFKQKNKTHYITFQRAFKRHILKKKRTTHSENLNQGKSVKYICLEGQNSS